MGLVRLRRSGFLKLVPLFLLLLLVVAVAPFLGPLRIDPLASVRGILDGEFGLDSQILTMTRLPRVLFAMVAGAALATAGLLFQALLRNDLADPYSLGVANASAVGALIALRYLPSDGNPWLLPLTSFLFGIGCVLLLLGLSRVGGGRLATPSSLLLAGVTLSFLFGAIIMLLQYLNDPFQTALMLRWLMGGLSVTSYLPIVVVGTVLLTAATLVLWIARPLNIITFGDGPAHHLGVSVTRVRLLGLFLAALLASTVVAYAGPVGFVGLIVPHMLRLIYGADHRLLIPACLMGGPVFLILCDAFARTAFAPMELPVGIITACLGSPFFLFLLLRRR